MIHGLYGLAHLGISHFHSLCKREEISYAVAYPNGLRKLDLGKRLKPFPVVVVSVVNFLKMHKKLRGNDTCIFVVDNPIQLEALGAKLIGCTKQNSYQYTFHPVDSSEIRRAIESSSEPIEIKPKKTKVIFELLKAASTESILAPVQTSIYQIKNPTIRLEIQDTFFDWIAGRIKDKKLYRALRQLSQEGVGEKLESLAKSEKFIQLRKAALYVWKEGNNYESAIKKYHVPMYDLRYVVKKQVLKYNVVLPG
jgi:hypothetical protein